MPDRRTNNVRENLKETHKTQTVDTQTLKYQRGNQYRGAVPTYGSVTVLEYINVTRGQLLKLKSIIQHLFFRFGADFRTLKSRAQLTHLFLLCVFVVQFLCPFLNLTCQQSSTVYSANSTRSAILAGLS